MIKIVLVTLLIPWGQDLRVQTVRIEEKKSMIECLEHKRQKEFTDFHAEGFLQHVCIKQEWIRKF